MGKWVESRVGKTLSISTIFYFILFCSSFGFCSVNPFLNVPDESGEPEPAALQNEAPNSLPDFSSYHILVYDPHNSSSSDTQAAMSVLGITNYTLRTSANPVTLADLNTHDILIVGWNSGGNHSGLSAGVLAARIAAEETNMDGAARIDNDIVDIGADEVDCSDVYHVKDLDGDGIVGLGDFGLFSKAWISWNPYVLDPNCPDHTYIIPVTPPLRSMSKRPIVFTGMHDAIGHPREPVSTPLI